jgi:hypothetical protein
MVVIDKLTRLRRHAAPIGDGEISAMVADKGRGLGSEDETEEGESVHVDQQ